MPLGSSFFSYVMGSAARTGLVRAATVKPPAPPVLRTASQSPNTTEKLFIRIQSSDVVFGEGWEGPRLPDGLKFEHYDQ